MVKITFTGGFEKEVRKVKDNSLRDRIKNHIAKLLEDPLSGKPLRYSLKGERTVYIAPYRIIYALKQEEIVLLRFRHRDEVYG